MKGRVTSSCKFIITRFEALITECFDAYYFATVPYLCL